MATLDGFAGGLAQGINNGVSMYGRMQAIKKAKAEQDALDEIKAAMAEKAKTQPAGKQDSGAETFAVAPPTSAVSGDQASAAQPFAVSQPGVDGGTAAQPLSQGPITTQPTDASGQPVGGAQSYQPEQSQPVMGQPTPQGTGVPQAASGPAAGLQDQQAPGLNTVLAQDQVGEQLGTAKKKDESTQQPGSPSSFLGGGEFGDMSDRLTRGIHKALEIGAFAPAIQLMTAREKMVGQYRDQALGEAMTQFNMTGDANSFVPFVNRFMPTSIRLDRVQATGQSANGEPVYVATGTNTETGKPYQHAFSQQSLLKYVGAAGDGATYRTMFVEQAKHLWDMQKFQSQERFKTDERVREKETLNARGINTSDREPAIVKEANWLLKSGIAKSAPEAYQKAKNLQGKSREDYALEYAKMVMKSQEGGMVTDKDRRTLSQAIAEGRAAYDENVGGGGGGRVAKLDGSVSTPKVGAVEDGFVFKGGDATDPANWEKQ